MADNAPMEYRLVEPAKLDQAFLEWVTACNELLNAQMAYLESLERSLAPVYPNLRRFAVRGMHGFYAPNLNEQMTDCEFRNGEAWPYFTHDGHKIFGSPQFFLLGYQDPQDMSQDFYVYPGWLDEMRNSRIPQPVIQKVRDHLSKKLTVEVTPTDS